MLTLKSSIRAKAWAVAVMEIMKEGMLEQQWLASLPLASNTMCLPSGQKMWSTCG